MSDGGGRSALTAEQVLTAAEEVLRRYGPAKTTVVDVARALGVSHGSVYRHFPSKAALREAVAERFLAEMSAPLADIEDDPRKWFDTLIATKRQRARGPGACSRPTPRWPWNRVPSSPATSTTS